MSYRVTTTWEAATVSFEESTVVEEFETEREARIYWRLWKDAYGVQSCTLETIQ